MAAVWGHLDVVQYLVAAGADPSIVSDAEGTAADMAGVPGREEVEAFLSDLS